MRNRTVKTILSSAVACGLLGDDGGPNPDKEKQLATAVKEP